MNKEELVEALKSLPLKDIAEVMNKSYEAFEVEELPCLPDRFTVPGYKTAFKVKHEDWDDLDDDSVYYAHVVSKPINHDTVVLKKGMLINGKALQSIEIADDGYAYVTLARGKKIL